MRAPGGLGGVWWLEEALAETEESACPPLASAVAADVCVVGGGYAGLWAAIEIREQAPDVSVVLVEARVSGFGASGRNGGWATGWHDELDALVQRFGQVEGVRLAARSSWAIDRVESFCGERGIDIRFRRAGAVKMAIESAQQSRWQPALQACRAVGRDRMLEPVDAAHVRHRTGSPLPVGGIRQTDAAAVQPALLALGLRRAAIQLGVRIYEATPMVALQRGRPASVITPEGRVDADRVVLALGAWSGMVRELRRATVPVGSHIVATEPLGDRIARLPWADGELFGDSRLMVHYAQVTSDGRIVFGQGGGAIGPSGRVTAEHFHDPRAIATIREDFRRWFPALADVRFTHAWGGPVDRAPGHLPFTGRLDGDGIFYVLGFSGNGVAPGALLGRIVARQALGVEDEDTRSPLATGPPRYLPPEPLRTMGGRMVKALVARSEAAEERGGHGIPHRLLKRLASATVPPRLEPRLRNRT